MAKSATRSRSCSRTTRGSRSACTRTGSSTDEASAGLDPVQTGATLTYTWEVVPGAGPQPGEPSSKLWLYHSHVNEQRDVAAGLVGPMLISAKGSLTPDGTPRDVDREFVVILYTLDERRVGTSTSTSRSTSSRRRR